MRTQRHDRCRRHAPVSWRQGFAMKKMVRGWLAVVLIGAVVVGGDHLLSGRGEQNGRGISAEAPVPVLAAAARVADVPVYLVGVGTVRALNLVTVRTQVSGTLVNIAF